MKRARLSLLVATGLLAAGVAAYSVSAASPNKPPYVMKFSWGTFKLSPKIADKLAKKEPINVILSMGGLTIPVYGPQYQYGFQQGLKQYAKQYGINLTGKVLGPATGAGAGRTEQVNELRSALAAGQADCITIEGGGDASFIPVINQAIKQGIPVWTTGTDIPKSNRFSTFHTDWIKEGAIAADASLKFFKQKGIALKVAMLHTGGIGEQWAQDRMNGFVNELKKIVPGVKITNTPKGALNTGYDPAQVYSQIKAYLSGHADVQLIYQTDISAEVDDKAITDLGKVGKVFTIGHNVSLGNLAAIGAGTQIGTLDQDYLAQSSYASRACAAFLTKGQVFPNQNVPVLITKENLAEQKAKFVKTTQPKR